MQIMKKDPNTTESVTPDQFRKVMSQFATGVAILTARDAGGEPLGMTINSLVSVSLEPSLIMFCLKKDGYFRSHVNLDTSIGINILNAHQAELARHFARYETRDWSQVNLFEHPLAPKLSDTIGFLAGPITAIYNGGDHDIMLARVESLEVSEQNPPLVFCRRAFGSMPI